MADNEGADNQAAVYEGRGGSVRLDGDDIVIRRKGLGMGAMKDPRRIPIGAIREVLWKGPSLATRAGYIHFVLGDSPVPRKLGHIAMSSHAETVDFDGKKDAAKFEELRDLLSRRIEANQAAGIDPASFDVPSVEENRAQIVQDEQAEEHRKMFGGRVVGRSDVADGAANADLVAKIKERPDLRKLASLDALRVHLEEGERLELLGVGIDNTVVALTDRQLIVVRLESGKKRVEEIPRADLSSAAWDGGFFSSGLTFYSAARSLKIGSFSREMGEQFISAVRSPVAPQQPVAAQPAPNVLDQIQKLAELRDAGVLTEEEFQANKVTLLERL